MNVDPQLSTLGQNKGRLTPEAARTMVMQFKDSDGVIAYKSKTAEKWNLPIRPNPVELALIKEWKVRGFCTVAYFQVFKDKAFITAHPSEGIAERDGKIFQDTYGAFVDPSSDKYREYFFSLIEEALEFQPDEIMLDYIRFPEYWGLVFPISKVAEEDINTKEKIIADFVGRLRSFVKSKSPNTKLSCAVFPPDNSVGQNYRLLASCTDTLSPMIYPNIFSGTVAGDEWKASFNAMVDSVRQSTTTSTVIVRPFLQGFQFYEEPNTRKRKTKALEDGLMRWQIQRMQELHWGCLIFSSSSSYSNVWAVLR